MKITCKSLSKHIFRPFAAHLEGLLDPLGEGWTLEFSESPTDPLGGRGWTLDFKKRAKPGRGGGGGYKVTFVLTSL